MIRPTSFPIFVIFDEIDVFVRGVFSSKISGIACCCNWSLGWDRELLNESVLSKNDDDDEDEDERDALNMLSGSLKLLK